MPLRLIDTDKHDDITTEYLLQDSNEQLWHGVSDASPEQLQVTDLTKLRKKFFDADRFYPAFNPSEMTKYLATCSGDPEVYIKYPRPLKLRTFFQDSTTTFCMHFIKREVKIGEILRKHPHPNLCAYKGVVLDRANRVVGIAYQRYEASLDHYLRFGKAFEKDLMLNSVTQAVKHMHALGLVHCDVHPANIFITRGASDQPDQVVLGDFDAVHSFGERMSTKIGRVEYTPSGFSWGVPVDKSVDEYGLSILEQKIRGPKFPPASAFRAYMNANFFGKTS